MSCEPSCAVRSRGTFGSEGVSHEPYFSGSCKRPGSDTGCEQSRPSGGTVGSEGVSLEP